MPENRIKILPDFLANQIAAGEVVQRPESVVKELVENSIDAGADTVAVIVKNAGKQLIHVVDNGSGMNEEDLRLSVKRHATSKIMSSEDLEEIMTFGFRGEALASIGSVANLEIRTKQKESGHGWKLIAEPNKEEVVEPCNTTDGSQIFVRNLFYNVPARRKFLKSNLTEFRHISDTMIKFSLSKPDIRFTFYDSDKLIFDVKPGPLTERVRVVQGDSIANSLIPVGLESQYAEVSGYVGQPQIAKQSKTGQFLFLNGRSIQSKALSHAVFSAFEHLLEKNNHPFFVLNLQIDPKNIDVNVHPQKHEVKFDDERFVYKLINQAVYDALGQVNMIPEIKFKEQESMTPFAKTEFSDLSGSSDMMLVNKSTGEILDPVPLRERPHTSNSFSFSDDKKDSFSPARETKTEISAFDDLFGKSRVNDEDMLPQKDLKDFETPDSMYWQLHRKYILVQSAKGMILIDQHNAHERILYERSIKAMNREFANSQDLLFPAKMRINSSEAALLNELKEDLKNLGYEFAFESDKENNVENIILTGVPIDVKTGAEEESFREIIEGFEENAELKHTDKRDNLAATFSCKSAIKTGHYLSVREMKKLHQDLMACQTPYVCPHGRPVIIEFSLRELDTRFGRSPVDEA